MKVYVLHENPDWYAPLAAALDAAGVPHEQWLLGDGVLDLDDLPPGRGVLVADERLLAHPRQHPHAKDHDPGRAGLAGGRGRRVVNGRRVLELEMSKAAQLTALRAAGFDVPRTVAVAGAGELRRRGQEAARAVHQQAQPGRQGARGAACSTATTSSTPTWNRRR